MKNYQFNKNYLKIFVLLLLIILPWILNKTTNFDSNVELSKKNIGYYQSNTCDLSFYDFVKNNLGNEFSIRLDKSASVNCFGKINGADVVEEKLVVYLGTNLNIDLIIQSFFWLTIISFIPKQKKIKIKYQNFSTFIILILIFLHLKGEVEFYKLNSKIFTLNLDNNYLLYSLLLTFFVIIYIFTILIEERIGNLLIFIPFIYIVYGTFNSSNLNLFLILLSYLGITHFLESKKYMKSFIILVAINIFWLSQLKSTIAIFDIDKLKGFSSSAYNSISIIFWSAVTYYSVIGIFYLLKSSQSKTPIYKLGRNLLISGSFIVLFSMISAVNPILNFLSYYFFGLNKTASKTFDSVAGNAWRGISPSAEMIGELFGISLLFIYLIVINDKKIKLSVSDYFFIFVNLYGLYKSNNFAVVVLLITSLIIIFIINKGFLKSNLKYYFATLLIAIPIFSINSNTFQEPSRKLIREGLEISYLESLDVNQFGENAVVEGRFYEVLINQNSNENISSSLRYLINEYHFSKRNYFPNITSAISIVATPVNRSEKWGIFFAKYNPNFQTLILGTGVNNLSWYYKGHLTKVNDGLVLPHSSFLSYLVFLGLFGILSFIIFISNSIYKHRNDLLYVILNIFIIINLLKNDSFLYFSSFVLYFSIFNLFKLNNYERRIEKNV